MRKLVLALLLAAPGCTSPAPPVVAPAAPTPESRALAFLAREVQSWPVENKCFSCHNNGDGARALYAAVRLQLPVPSETLAATNRWLAKPDTWHINGGDVDFKDEGLSRIQFAAALLAAHDSGQVSNRAALVQAAELVAAGQSAAGCWQGEFPGDVGSPVTYGAALATAQARHVLRSVDAPAYAKQIALGEAWLLAAPVARVVDAAAVLLGLGGATGESAAQKRRECLETIRKGQGSDGGWGPFVNAPAEVFDTALVLLALQGQNTAEMRQRGRSYLIAQQQEDGSWTETTRPTGGESYAQRLSTTGWATLALLATK